jgi:hypothetical protein
MDTKKFLWLNEIDLWDKPEKSDLEVSGIEKELTVRERKIEAFSSTQVYRMEVMLREVHS